MAPQQQQPLPQRLVLTAAAASVAETCTYPIDMVKTQLQLQTKAAAPLSSSSTPAAVQQRAVLGAWGTAAAIVRQQGVPGLYTGLSPAILRHLFYTCTRISVYEELRSTYLHHAANKMQQPAPVPSTISSTPGNSSSSSSHTGTPTYVGSTSSVPDKAGSSSSSVPFATKLLLGLTAGAVAQLIAVPADLLKVRMQADARAVQLGQQSCLHYPSLAAAAAAVWREGGLLGMWRGGLPAVQRAALVNLGELATYDQAKSAVLSSGVVSEGLLPHCSASIMSGLVASLVSTPADVVKTRLMAQQTLGGSSSTPTSSSSTTTTTSSSSCSSSAAAGSACSTSRHYSSWLHSQRTLTAAAAATRQQQQRLCSSSQGSRPVASSGGVSAGSSQGASSTAGSRGVPSGVVQYRGAWDCLVKTVKAEGFLGLYKGFFPTWARLGPWQLVFWVSYEQLRHAANLGAF